MGKGRGAERERMKKEQEDVVQFMTKAGQDCPAKPTIPSEKVIRLRRDLIQEELNEFWAASCGSDLVEVADAITDLMVVVIGTGVAFGIDLQPCWDEVHRSNMSKFIDGHRRDDGKWIKGPSYSPANLAPILEAQSKGGVR